MFATVGKPIADSCLAGFYGTIFAYGQTGSGKTFTIQGKDEVFVRPDLRSFIKVGKRLKATRFMSCAVLYPVL